jgi:Tol biopolymer transport system component
MSTDEVIRTLRAGLDHVRVPDESWESALGSIARRRSRRRSRTGAILAASSAITITAVGASLAASQHSGISTPAARSKHHVTATSPAASHSTLPGDKLTAHLAAQPGFLVYEAGLKLDTAVNSATSIVAGNSAWTANRNDVMLASGTATRSYTLPAANPARTEVALVEGPARQLTQFNDEGDIAVAAADGTNLRVLTTSGTDTDPTWSPSGKQIAFLRIGYIWLMSANGSNQHALGIPLQANSLAWSPNGQEFAVGSGDSPERIAIINIAKRSYTWFTKGSRTEQYQPSFSPDSKQLVYGQTGPNSLFISNLNGTGTRQLTTCTIPACTQDLEPIWSPNGADIIFVRSVYGVVQIAEVKATGGTVRYLTTGPYQHELPQW